MRGLLQSKKKALKTLCEDFVVPIGG